MEYNGRRYALILSVLCGICFSGATYLTHTLFTQMSLGAEAVLLPCGIFFLLALIVHNVRFTGSIRYAFSTLLNALAAGTGCAAYFIGMALPYGFLDATYAFLLFVGMTVLDNLVFLFIEENGKTDTKMDTAATGLIFTVWFLVLISLIAFWCLRPLEQTVWAALCLAWIWLLCLLVGAHAMRDSDRHDAARTYSFWSFGAALTAVGAAALALAIAGGGDCSCDGCDCDGCDCGGGGGKKKKK